MKDLKKRRDLLAIVLVLVAMAMVGTFAGSVEDSTGAFLQIDNGRYTQSSTQQAGDYGYWNKNNAALTIVDSNPHDFRVCVQQAQSAYNFCMGNCQGEIACQQGCEAKLKNAVRNCLIVDAIALGKDASDISKVY